MHAECLEQYVLTEVDKLKKTNYIAARADTAQASGDSKTLEWLSGCCLCPKRGHGCNAAPFGNRELAHVLVATQTKIFSDHVRKRRSDSRRLLFPLACERLQLADELDDAPATHRP